MVDNDQSIEPMSNDDKLAEDEAARQTTTVQEPDAVSTAAVAAAALESINCRRAIAGWIALGSAIVLTFLAVYGAFHLTDSMFAEWTKVVNGKRIDPPHYVLVSVCVASKAVVVGSLIAMSIVFLRTADRLMTPLTELIAIESERAKGRSKSGLDFDTFLKMAEQLTKFGKSG